MPIYSYNGHKPEFHDKKSNWVAPDASLIGKVVAGENASFWYGAVLRGDNEFITVGANSNIQEHCVLHTDLGYPLTIGKGCTIGHRAILHGCTLGDNTLIGMGAIVLNGAKIGNNCLVGAGALVTEGKEFPDNSLIVGSPARVIRELDEQAVEQLRISAQHYVEKAHSFMRNVELVDDLAL